MTDSLVSYRYTNYYKRQGGTPGASAWAPGPRAGPGRLRVSPGDTRGAADCASDSGGYSGKAMISLVVPGGPGVTAWAKPDGLTRAPLTVELSRSSWMRN
jgi:hypothetical protein